VFGLSHNSMFLLDGRIPKINKCVQEKQYASKVHFNKLGTSNQGYIATGSTDGVIRMYDTLGKKAKTLLPGLGSSIEHVEVSGDGKWLLCTCKDYLMVVPTVVPGTERTGFQGRGMGKQKPRPYVLRLKPSDIAKYKLSHVHFTPAHFDSGDDSIFEENWIVSSTGPFIVKWNFRKLKKSGIVNSYSIRRTKTEVVHNTFRHNHADDILVSERDKVYAQHCSKKEKGQWGDMEWNKDGIQ